MFIYFVRSILDKFIKAYITMNHQFESIIMNYEIENQKIAEIKEKIKAKLKEKGLDKDKIDQKMIALDVEFLKHSLINGTMENMKSIEERLDFYIKILEMYLETEFK